MQIDGWMEITNPNLIYNQFMGNKDFVRILPFIGVVAYFNVNNVINGWLNRNKLIDLDANISRVE